MASRTDKSKAKTFAAVFEKNKKRKRGNPASAKDVSNNVHGDDNNAEEAFHTKKTKQRPPKKRPDHRGGAMNKNVTKRNDHVHQNNENEEEPQHKKKKKQRPPKKRPAASDAVADAPRNPKKKKLSQQALDLSAKLKECSQRKQLQEALDLYWDKAHDDIRDGFHSCITIDCCARCGAMSEVEKILQELSKNGQILSIETNTSAIKGYAHAGNMQRAFQIFESMCKSNNINYSGKNKTKLAKTTTIKPNVRTLNTLLRGCRWTAATLDDQDRIFGGVVTSEKAWGLYQDQFETSIKSSSSKDIIINNNNNHKDKDATSPQLDVSSYEYSISLLSQALCIEKAEKRIEELKEQYDMRNIEDKQPRGGNPSAWETLAVAFLGLGRAKALLGDRNESLKACRLARQAIKASKESHEPENGEQQPQDPKNRLPGGEKRAWKSDDDRRATSNTIFRNHRLCEAELELRSIISICEGANFPPARDALACRLVRGLFYFSGGGTTKMDGNDVPTKIDPDDKTESKLANAGRLVRRQVLNASWFSFGLQASLRAAEFDDLKKLPDDFIRVREAERIYRVVGKEKQMIQDDGRVDFSKVFPGEANEFDIELGSGHGDWIVHQAVSLPNRNHVAVELRADRVSQIFSKGFLQEAGPLENLCVIGDDCTSFLMERVKPGSVATIFANHPEPPTQVHGKSDKDLQDIVDGDVETAHMLNSKALMAAAKCLQDSSAGRVRGRIVIVTDNINYARLLCATVVKISRQHRTCLRSCQLDVKTSSGLKEIESFPLRRSKKTGGDRVVLLEGQPSSVIGHAVSRSSNQGKGSSYFDRLWRTGASGHASRRERYIIALERLDAS